jgi:hypothetical protein
MVIVSQRPQGIKIIDQPISAIIYNHFGVALVGYNSHSLVTGDFVYIESDIDEYNGIWNVDVLNVDTFRIREYIGTPYIPYYQDADITYYQAQTHAWSSAFLPIVYKATNNMWPLNYADATVSVTSQADDNGYTLLNISAPTGADPLEYVKLSDGNVYQVIENGSGTTTINLAYDAGNSFSTAVKYYNNYQVKVRIYAGLEAGQYWQAKKPFREVATLSLTPDADNNVMFSVAEYIRGLLAIKNNPTQFSMPLNLDAFTAFYIELGDSYDGSDGYTITTDQSSYSLDPFVGYAAAGKLPFKNQYSGYYSEYVYTSGQPAKWLNTLTTVMGVVDQYFDLSFIKNVAGPFNVLIDKWANDYLYATETVEYEDFGLGVYRIPLTFSSEYDQFCVRIVRPSYTDGFVSPDLPLLSAWTNIDTGGPAWSGSDSPTIDFDGLGLSVLSDTKYTAYAFEAGQIYTFGYQVTGDYSCSALIIRIYDVSMNVLSTVTITVSTNPTTGSYVFEAPAGAAGVGLIFSSPCSCGSPGGGCVKTLVYFTNDTPSAEVLPELTLTEELCIDIYEICGFGDGATIEPTAARRLLEDGGFRLLED